MRDRERRGGRRGGKRVYKLYVAGNTNAVEQSQMKNHWHRLKRSFLFSH